MSLRPVLFIVGGILLLGSAPMLWQQGVEEYFARRARARYSVQAIDASTTTLAGRVLSVTSAQVVVGTRVFPRIPRSDVALVNLIDREVGKAAAAVVERWGGAAKESWRYRIIAMDTAGAVSVEEFGFEERNGRPYRVIVAQYASPEMISFMHQSTTYWPGLLYPILYPWLTAVLGLTALVTAARQRS